MDADYDEGSHSKQDQEMVKNASRKRGRHRKSKFAKVLAKQKPVFDPQEKKFESYFDEYYQLDFEDVVGGMPCRFHYRQVQPNSFGLSTEEVRHLYVTVLLTQNFSNTLLRVLWNTERLVAV